MEKRRHERKLTSLHIQVTNGSRTWRGTCINLSEEGALLKLDSLWDGDEELEFRLDVDSNPKVSPTRARIIRATSPDHLGSFLAIRFL